MFYDEYLLNIDLKCKFAREPIYCEDSDFYSKLLMINKLYHDKLLLL